MREQEPSPETQNRSVLNGEFNDLTNPQAYFEVAKKGLAGLRNLFSAVEK